MYIRSAVVSQSMLISSNVIQTPTTRRLIRLWENRYALNFADLLFLPEPFSYSELVAAALPQGKTAIANKLQSSDIYVRCELACIRSRELYEQSFNRMSLTEARNIAAVATMVYQKLLQIYQSSYQIDLVALERVLLGSQNAHQTTWGLPSVLELANALEPDLLQVQQQYFLSREERTFGFMTTLFNFSNELLLERLDPIERFLLAPYFQFLEEQVALPWQRICAAAAKHQLNSPLFSLVEYMFPLSQEISEIVYRRLVQQLPNHQSRRGKLTHPGIRHSCLRDLNMFQAYLWLSVLEQNNQAIEQELITLCIIVMQSLDVRWNLIERWTVNLCDEIMHRLDQSQQFLLLPYTQRMQQAFYLGRSQFGVG